MQPTSFPIDHIVWPVTNLIAQAAIMETTSFPIRIVVLLAVLGGGFVVGVMLLLHLVARRSRPDEERAQLFEMGYYLPRRPSRWPQTFFCTAMGLGVPVVALAFASTRYSFSSDVWVVACIISVAAIVGATVVAGVVFFRPEPSGQPEKLVPIHAKPATDPDAIDFAGRLGHG